MLAVTLYHIDPAGRVVLHAMPVMLAALLVLAIAYRYYSAFLAAKVAVLDASRVTPAHRFHDGQNYHPTNKWVLFGHHFAAISGAGPLIGPVLAIQYGYMPGLIWLVLGVCLAGAVQDMLVMAASVRREGKSLAEIARVELGRPAAAIASAAILFIVVIALAGLGMVVVKALGGEQAKLPEGMVIAGKPEQITYPETFPGVVQFGPGCSVQYQQGGPSIERSEAFGVYCPSIMKLNLDPRIDVLRLPAGCKQIIPGSSWGTFTIACTIPIALLVGWWMFKLRPGRVMEASLIGGGLVLLATVAGGWIPGSRLEPFFSLSRDQTIIALTTYGFIAAVLPVWLLLGPRDYLSSFLKIGTVVLLIGSVLLANPPLHAPQLNEVFINGGPTFQGNIFPFVFICVMCGAVSGFHSLVASGTTPKMLENELHIRPIGYGAMLVESIVGVTALIAAASLPNDLYYDINIAIEKAPDYVGQLQQIESKYGRDRLAAVGVDRLEHLNLGAVEERVGGESLRGRTGGAVTLAVGMSVIFERAFERIGITAEWLLKYWYHFAIMFEALFILTTIDAGTRIGRFLLQETLGRAWRPFARQDWLPGTLIASAAITGGWGYLIWGGSIDTIWPMFGVANQALAVLALTVITGWLINNGRARLAWVTLVPMLFVGMTTFTAGKILITERFPLLANKTTAAVNIGLTIFVLCSVAAVVLLAIARWLLVRGVRPPRSAQSPST